MKDVEEDVNDLKPLRMRRRKRRRRKITDDLDEFEVGDDFEEIDDLDYEDNVSEPRVSKKRKGRSKSAEEGSTESKQCVDCGVVLAYATKKDKQRYRDHMVVHERERFTCDCDCEFADG